MPDTPTRTYDWDFFIAYASQDRAVAEDLYSHLSRNARVFLDQFSIDPGTDGTLNLPKLNEPRVSPHLLFHVTLKARIICAKR